MIERIESRKVEYYAAKETDRAVKAAEQRLLLSGIEEFTFMLKDGHFADDEIEDVKQAIQTMIEEYNSM